MNKSVTTSEAERWASDWLDGVADGTYTMSQRKLTSVDRQGRGIEAVRRVAEARGVHLLMLEDDEGEVFLAASAKPCKVVC